VDLVGVLPVENNRIRYFSHFGDPNDFALLIVTFIPFLLVNLFSRHTGKLKKLLLGIALSAFVLALYFTNSRGGYIAFLVLLIYFAITRWGFLKGMAVGAILLVTALAIAPSRMAEISPYGRSAGGRIEAWTAGLVMLKSRPVFGVGFMNFGVHHDLASHSAFILCLSEMGLMGYLIWMSLLYTSFKGLRSLEKSAVETPYKKYARILKLSFVGFIVSALFLSQAYSPILYILLALITLAIHNPDTALKIPRFLKVEDLVRVTAIVVMSIIAFKVIAMIFI
jgi:O-antigen ligase